MERLVLLAGEQIADRAPDAGEPGEVGDRRLVDVDPADAAVLRAEVTDDGAAAIEAARAAAQTAEQVEVADLHFPWGKNHRRALPVFFSPAAGFFFEDLG